MPDPLPQPRLHRNDGPHATAPRFREAINVMRQFVDRNLVAAALAHLLLKDPRATDFVRTAFLDIIDWNPDLHGPYSAHSPWGDELGLSLNRCLFAVYDWTFELYDDHQHAYIRSTLANYARQIATTLNQRNFFTSPGDSHAGRMPAYLGAAAMVLKGYIPDAEAEAWLQSALDIYGTFFPHYGGRDGAWAEGTFYSTSYTKWYLPFFFALERHVGFSFLNRPFYRNYAQYLIHFNPPGGEGGSGWEIHPFGDGYWCHPEDAEWPGFFAQDPYSVYAERFGPNLARQYAALQPKPKLFQLHLLDVFRNPRHIAPGSPGVTSRTPINEPNQKGLEPRPENTRWFRDAGFVSMHANLDNPNTDTAVLVRASRYGAVSHQHADQGNFAIISHGKALISPSGYYGHGYGTRHHFNWTNQTIAHNCILVDGIGQKARDFHTTGKIESVEDDGPTAQCVLDLSAAYPQLQSYRRHILFFRPNLVIIHDDLHSATEVEYAWLAHTLSPPSLDGDTITVHRDPASMRLQLFSRQNEKLAFSFTDRFAVDLNEGVAPENHRHQPNQYHLTWRAPKAKSRRFYAVIALNGAPVTTKWIDDKLIIESAGRTVAIEKLQER
jgi:hypothetical protein